MAFGRGKSSGSNDGGSNRRGKSGKDAPSEDAQHLREQLSSIDNLMGVTDTPDTDKKGRTRDR